jgi:hypothetical protein
MEQQVSESCRPFQGACVDARFLFSELLIVSLEPRAILLSPVSVVRAIACRDSDSLNVFCHKYERGLRFLIRRYCLHNADELFNAVVKASMVAVVSGEISRDDDLPALIYAKLHCILLTLAEVSPAQNTKIFEEVRPEGANVVSDLILRLNLFKPSQREALFRFYGQQESASSVCRDLALTREHFEFTCKVAKQAARLSIENSREPTVHAI